MSAVEFRILHPDREPGDWLPFRSATPATVDLVHQENVVSIVVNYDDLPPFEYRRAAS